MSIFVRSCLFPPIAEQPLMLQFCRRVRARSTKLEPSIQIQHFNAIESLMNTFTSNRRWRSLHQVAASALITSSFVLAQASLAQAAEIVAGPMAGARDMRTTKIWVMADSTTEARVEYWNINAADKKLQSAPVKLVEAEQFAGHLEVVGLEPGQRFEYRILLDGKPSKLAPQQFATQELWMWRKDAPDFRAAIGSCTYVNEPSVDRPGRPYGGFYQIFGNVAKTKPDMMLWLGDNTYFREADEDSEYGMSYRHRHTRVLPEMQALLRTGNHYATWDDHDYGPNDSNASYVHKASALKLFQRYWANPSYGLPEMPGVTTSFRYNDVEFFMLDNRWYRDSDRDTGSADRAQFGKQQIKWLKNALSASVAPWKVVVGGGQFLNEGARSEGWHRFPQERQEFLDWLDKSRVDGIVFLSGDRHFTALYRIQRSGNYALNELTCSPMTAGVNKQDFERSNPRIVPGTLVEEQRNFCTLDFKGNKANREMIINVFDSDGKQVMTQSIKQADLVTPKR
jgi:alkaline phosphatase D